MASSQLVQPQTQETPESSDLNASPEGATRKPRIQSRYALPSDRIAWARHIPLLTSAAMRSSFGKQPVDSAVIQDGVGAQAAELNVGFLTEAGLLTKVKRQYLPTEACLDFARMQSIDPERAKAVLRPVIKATWFAETVQNCLSLKRTATLESLMKELAIASKVTDFEAKRPSFVVLIEYLVYTGLLSRDGDQLTWNEATSAPVEVPSVPTKPFAAGPAPMVPTMPVAPVVPSVTASPGPTPAQAAPEQGWVRKSWPGCYDLAFNPNPNALKLLERAVQEIRAALADSEPEPAP